LLVINAFNEIITYRSIHGTVVEQITDHIFVIVLWPRVYLLALKSDPIFPHRYASVISYI